MKHNTCFVLRYYSHKKKKNTFITIKVPENVLNWIADNNEVDSACESKVGHHLAVKGMKFVNAG